MREKDDNVRMLLSEQEQWQTQWQQQRQDMLTKATAHEAEIEQLNDNCLCFVEHISMLEQQLQQQQQQQHTASSSPLTLPLSLPQFKLLTTHPHHSHHTLHTHNPLHQSMNIPLQGIRAASSAFSSSSTLFNLSQSAISTPRSTPLESENHSIVTTDNVGHGGLSVNATRLFQPLSFAPKVTPLPPFFSNIYPLI